MKSTSIFFTLCSVICGWVLTACHPNVQPGNETLASVVPVINHTADFYLTDYFPTFENVDSITSDDAILTQIDGWNHIRINTSATLGALNVWKNGKKTDLLLITPKTKAFEAGRLFSLDLKRNTLKIGFTQKPELVLAIWQNTLLDNNQIQISDECVQIILPKHITVPERSFVRVYACAHGQLFSDLLIPLSHGKPVESTIQLNRHDKQAQVLYSLMIDRFMDGDSTNDCKLNRPDVLPQVDYMGGDIAGITKKIKEGFFDSLGINTLWISPITQNPYDAWGQYHHPETKFSGYHGYWPIYVTQIDKRFGNDAQLKEMLATAHEHNINVILDYVANHLHINSPVLQQHPDWITDSITPDGRRNFELWDEFRLTTWFDVHIPTLDLERPEVYEPMTDSALYWMANYDFDGFRHDACKHIPLEYWRTLTKKMKTRFPDRDLWQIGETYGSPELIGSYVKSGILDAQFNFNVYHTAIDVIGREGRSMKDLQRVILESESVYGAHHVMGNISGNHDKARFISLAGGAVDFDEDHKQAGWNRNITVGDTTIAYKKSLLLETLNFTIPGVPCIYQGDEYGQPGANDPDNRRMMRFDGYNIQEQQHLDAVENLISLRRHSMPLLYGDYLPLYTDDNVMAFARIYMGKTVIVVLNKDTEEHMIYLSLPTEITINGAHNISLSIEPLGYRIITDND